MLLGHFCFIVAGEAVIARPAGCMAAAALSIRVPMIHRKIMVEGCPTPGRSGMALGALTVKVVRWLPPAVAGFAICGTRCSVVKICTRPLRCAVTG